MLLVEDCARIKLFARSFVYTETTCFFVRARATVGTFNLLPNYI